MVDIIIIDILKICQQFCTTDFLSLLLPLISYAFVLKEKRTVVKLLFNSNKLQNILKES
jgi:hypothetical protein